MGIIVLILGIRMVGEGIYNYMIAVVCYKQITKDISALFDFQLIL